VGNSFRVDLSRQGSCIIASAFGEIDLATAPALVEAIESELGRSTPARLVIDLSEVSFLDSSGLNALVRLQKLLEDRAIALRLVIPSGHVVRQVFEITSLTEPLSVVGGLDDALL
jgi:anti-anti-sigma factor